MIFIKLHSVKHFQFSFCVFCIYCFQNFFTDISITSIFFYAWYFIFFLIALPLFAFYSNKNPIPYLSIRTPYKISNTFPLLSRFKESFVFSVKTPHTVSVAWCQIFDGLNIDMNSVLLAFHIVFIFCCSPFGSNDLSRMQLC